MLLPSLLCSRKYQSASGVLLVFRIFVEFDRNRLRIIWFFIFQDVLRANYLAAICLCSLHHRSCVFVIKSTLFDARLLFSTNTHRRPTKLVAGHALSNPNSILMSSLRRNAFVHISIGRIGVFFSSSIVLPFVNDVAIRRAGKI